MRSRVSLADFLLAATTLCILAGAVMPREPRQKNKPGLIVTSLPACGENEFLVYRGGIVVCEELKTDLPPQAPDCTGKLLSVQKNAGVSSLTCVAKGGK